MRNFLFTFQPLHYMFYLKTGQYSVCRILTDSSSFLEHKLYSTDMLNKTRSTSVRALCTTARKLEKLTQLREKEEKPENSLIYYGSLTGQIKGVKIFTCISSIGGIALQPLMLQNLINGDNLPLGVALMTTVGFFTFVTPFLIHSLTRKYVTEIQYNSATDTYTATILSFFLRRIDFQFKVGDVTVPNMLPMFTTMIINGRPVFVICDCFLDMDHYIKMMGYDKPIDLKLSSVTTAGNGSSAENKPKSEMI